MIRNDPQVYSCRRFRLLFVSKKPADMYSVHSLGRSHIYLSAMRCTIVANILTAEHDTLETGCFTLSISKTAQ